jgi:hypothetical protein
MGMKRTSAARAVRRIALSLVSCPRVRAANDNARPTAQDIALAAIEAEWLQIHRSTFRGRSMRITVRYVGELVTEELVLAHTGRRVETWRVEVSEPIESVQRFLLPVS